MNEPSTNRGDSAGVFRQLVLLLTAAFLFGGGGVPAALNNLIVQLTALVIIAWNPAAILGFFRRAPRFLSILAVATCALPLVQLLPLPPAVWTALPGRDLVLESLLLIEKPGWFPLSVDRARTLVAFLGTLAPFVTLCLAANLSEAELHKLQRVMVIFGVSCAILGMLQLLGLDFLRLQNNTDVLSGTFGNRNSTGIFLVCCLVFLCTLPATSRTSASVAIRLGAGLLLLLGAVLTQSRSSMVLLIIPAALVALRILHFWRGSLPASSKWRSKKMVAAIASLCILSVPLAALLLEPSRVETSLSRFDQAEDARPEIWEDALYAAVRYWPVGAGTGTFDEVFQIDESLEYLVPAVTGRAHNEYLEVMVESGLIGIVLVLCWLLWSCVTTFRACRLDGNWAPWGAAGVIGCLALQSVVDYPMRNQTILCLAVIAVAILAHHRQRTEGSRP